MSSLITQIQSTFILKNHQICMKTLHNLLIRQSETIIHRAKSLLEWLIQILKPELSKLQICQWTLLLYATLSRQFQITY